MNEILSFSGQLPEHFDAAFAEIGPELGFARAGQGGLSVALRQGGCLRAEKRADGVVVTWAEPVQVYRALSLLRQHWAEDAFCIEETPCFETAGMMFDVSRNAVLQPDTLRFFLRKMAMMGLNLGMMYTEDTYEVPGQPYFGYQRGRYSADELRALDDYADMLGIELCPCIQTLGHLNRALHWPALAHLKDNEEVLRKPTHSWRSLSRLPPRPTVPNASTSAWTRPTASVWARTCAATATRTPTPSSAGIFPACWRSHAATVFRP